MPNIYFIIQKHSAMGCGTPTSDSAMGPKVVSPIGKLRITLVNATIYHKVSSLKMDPYMIVGFNSQVFTSKVIKDGDKSPVFSDSFSFFINSCYKSNGRNLQLTLMDKKRVLSDSEIGFGIIDLDPIVNKKLPRLEFRNYLSYNREKAALVNLIGEFQEEPYQVLNMRFDGATIRRKTRTLGSMNCWVQVVAGEELLKTDKKKEIKQLPPSWSESFMTMMVPESLKGVDVIVMDDDTEVGRLTMGTKELLGTNKEQQFSLDFVVDQKVNAGTLRFVTKTGVNPSFTAPRASLPVPIPIKEEVVQTKPEPKKKAQESPPKQQQQPKKVEADNKKYDEKNDKNNKNESPEKLDKQTSNKLKQENAHSLKPQKKGSPNEHQQLQSFGPISEHQQQQKAELSSNKPESQNKLPSTNNLLKPTDANLQLAQNSNFSEPFQAGSTENILIKDTGIDPSHQVS